MRRAIVSTLGILLALAPARAEIVTIAAVRDATLIEDSNGALGNGAGPALFAGRTAQSDNGVRRALLYFDASRELPRRGKIVVERVARVLTNRTQSSIEPAEYRLHRVLSDWGEGPSASSGGGGAPAEPGDATWIHTFHDEAFWMHNGGQFDGEPSARVVVTGPGVYRFEGPRLLRDIWRMAADPSRNFGWILIGDETRRQAAREFGSRENPDPAIRPGLEITCRVVP